MQTVKKVETRTKYALALAIAALAVGGYITLPPALATNEQAQNDMAPLGTPPLALRLARHPLLRYVLKNGKPVDLIGTASVLEGHILVMKMENSNSVNVVVPGKWVVGNEVLATEELFQDGVFKLGETQLTVKTLGLELKTETHTVDAYFTYAISGDGATANALLPFNIKVP